MPFATPRTLKNLSPFIVGTHSLKLQQQLILWPIGSGRIDENRLDPVALPFFCQQDLIGIFPAEPVWRERKHCLNLAFGGKITDTLQAWP